MDNEYSPANARKRFSERFFGLDTDVAAVWQLGSVVASRCVFQVDEYRRSWRAVLTDLFRRRWMKEYLPLLQRRQKWLQPQRNLKVGDLVLVCDENSKRGAWPKAIVEETFPDGDGTVTRVRTVSTEYLRDVRKLCLLEASD